MGVNEEKLEAILGKNLFHSRALEGLASLHSCRSHGKLPWPGGPVSTLRQPDAAWTPAKKTFVRSHTHAYLGADGSVGSQQRKVTVGGAAGDDLDGPGIVEVAKAGDYVPSQRFEVAGRVFEKARPELSHLRKMRFPAAAEIVRVLLRGINFLLGVFQKLFFEGRMRELFQQNGRKIDVGFERQALALQLGKDPQQGQIGFRGGFVQPVEPMRPRSVVHHIR